MPQHPTTSPTMNLPPKAEDLREEEASRDAQLHAHLVETMPRTLQRGEDQQVKLAVNRVAQEQRAHQNYQPPTETADATELREDAKKAQVLKRKRGRGRSRYKLKLAARGEDLLGDVEDDLDGPPPQVHAYRRPAPQRDYILSFPNTISPRAESAPESRLKLDVGAEDDYQESHFGGQAHPGFAFAGAETSEATQDFELGGEAADLGLSRYAPFFDEGLQGVPYGGERDERVLGTQASQVFRNDLWHDDDDDDEADLAMRRERAVVQGVQEFGIAQSRESDFRYSWFDGGHRLVIGERGVPAGLVQLARRVPEGDEELGATKYLVNAQYQEKMQKALEGRLVKETRGTVEPKVEVTVEVNLEPEVRRATDSRSVGKGLKEVDEVEKSTVSWMNEPPAKRRVRVARRI